MKSLSIAYAMKQKAKKMAQGGMVDEEDSGYEALPSLEESPEQDSVAPQEDDIVERIMKQRMSEGGMVANGGEDDLSQIADGKENEFDDLANRDDLSFSYTGENSGDNVGNSQLDEDEKDIVARVMASLAKKDRMPSIK